MESESHPWRRRYAEGPLVKTKIVATLGPASQSPDRLRELIEAGADVFRLNFAHGEHDWHAQIVGHIRALAQELARPIGILGDLSGPKIRLGELPDAGFMCRDGERIEFVQTPSPGHADQLTCSYEKLIDDLRPGDRVLLADGTVALRVESSDPILGRAVCVVEQPGLLRSRQGVNLPGVALSTPAITPKDEADLHWALDHQLDYIGLSFVRSADDIRQLRQLIEAHGAATPPWIVAKIEKTEAIIDLENVLKETDAVMVARGDLGVESDIARVPALQKRIIRLCNERRLPVIVATQMLDSMQKNERPTRAEVSDVANAILDGTDAVMLSGETAVGDHPVAAVAMMSRIAQDAERLVAPRPEGDLHATERSRATAITEAITHGAGAAADRFGADLIAVATRGGKTALALSKQRRPVPVIAMTDRPEVARRMTLFWGVYPVETNAVAQPPQEQLHFVEAYGRELAVLAAGSKLVLVGSSDWTQEYHDMLLACVVTGQG
jgi:pyruvate kinase